MQKKVNVPVIGICPRRGGIAQVFAVSGHMASLTDERDEVLLAVSRYFANNRRRNVAQDRADRASKRSRTFRGRGRFAETSKLLLEAVN